MSQLSIGFCAHLNEESVSDDPQVINCNFFAAELCQVAEHRFHLEIVQEFVRNCW